MPAATEKHYRIALFDVGETLVGPRRSFGHVYADVLAELGRPVEPERLGPALRQAGEYMATQVPPGVDRYRHYPGGEQEYWSRFAEHALSLVLNPAPQGEEARESLRRLRTAFARPEAWEIYPDTLPTLDGLRDRGVPMGVVSNWDSNLDNVLRMNGLDGYFETVGCSHIEGVEKPHRGLFDVVLERMGRSAAEALHVGDRPDMDWIGARAAGVDALVIDRNGRHTNGPAPTIRALTEILSRF